MKTHDNPPAPPVQPYQYLVFYYLATPQSYTFDRTAVGRDTPITTLHDVMEVEQAIARQIKFTAGQANLQVAVKLMQYQLLVSDSRGIDRQTQA